MKNKIGLCIVVSRWYIEDDAPTVISVYEIEKKNWGKNYDELKNKFIINHPEFKHATLEIVTLEKQ